MKDKLPNDRLEEFLRKSLEGHSEDPPGDLWSKIEGNLEPPLAVQPRISPLRGWWRMAAVAAVVAGLFMGQHLYFSSKINHLSQELAQKTTELKQLEQRKLTEQNSIESKAAPMEAIESMPAPQSTEHVKGSTSEPNFAPQKKAVANSSAVFPKEKKPKNGTENAEHSMPVFEKNKVEAGANEVANGAQKGNETTGEQKQLETLLHTSEEMAAMDKTDLQKVWMKKMAAVDFQTTAAPLVNAVLPFIPASSGAAQVSVGVHAMPMVSRRKIKSVREDVHGPTPGHPEMRPSDMASTGQTLLAGLVLEAAVAPRLQIGLGADYQTVDYETTHKIRFKFKERVHGPGPGNDHEHEFQYDLNTAAGTVEMEVRAESSEAAQDIPDDEKVEAEIKTSQHLAFFSMPLYASYRFGEGRLRVLAKGGIMFNFLLDNDFTIGPINSFNPKFEFRRNQNQIGSPSNLQSVSADFIAGLGLEYRLTKGMSLRLEPTVIGSLTSLHNNPRIESSEFSAGLNIGMIYSF